LHCYFPWARRSDHLGAAMSGFAINDVPVLWVATLTFFASLYEMRTNGLGRGGGDMESSSGRIATAS
jgi:hypothetical protein